MLGQDPIAEALHVHSGVRLKAVSSDKTAHLESCPLSPLPLFLPLPPSLCVVGLGEAWRQKGL